MGTDTTTTAARDLLEGDRIIITRPTGERVAVVLRTVSFDGKQVSMRYEGYAADHTRVDGVIRTPGVRRITVAA